MYKLLNVGRNTKTAKSDKISEYLTAIMYMSPINTRICPFQDIAGCKAPCLNTAGRGGMNVVQRGRLKKTNWFLNDEPSFIEQLYQDISKYVRHCARHDRKPAVRLNGTSDIQWEYKKYLGQTLFEHFPSVQFYDYTKIPTRKIADIPNYNLTWSYSAFNPKYAEYFDTALDKGMNVAVVFNHDLPKEFKGVQVIDGDKHDLRFLDGTNVVVGLRAKGKARKDTTGFVIHFKEVK